MKGPLASNVSVEVQWVPTWANPSDAPTRECGVGEWRAKVQPVYTNLSRELRETPELRAELGDMVPYRRAVADTPLLLVRNWLRYLLHRRLDEAGLPEVV